jgi:16S rRNA (cytosine967-C5)-methyltransferase
MKFKSKPYPFLKQQKAPINLRHACFSALLEYEKKGKKIDKSLKEWREINNPKSIDYKLAQEIAFGVVKRKLTLEFFIKQIDDINKLKLREKLVLKMALYQMQFMNKIPFYAIVSESVILAKKVISIKTGAFFNALLKKIENKVFKKIPSKDLDILYSYPKYFIDLLVHQFDLKQAQDLLAVMNLSPFTFVKKRNIINNYKLKKEDADIVYEKGFILYKLKNMDLIDIIKNNPDYYFQSLTQTKLIDWLTQKTKDIFSVIDLCSAPGGKLLAVNDLYPNAELYANDVSSLRLNTLKENIKKYELNVKVYCEPAEKITLDKSFDLVIVDMPCSNSGVLNRRAEARWAITKDRLHGLIRLQKEILKNAVRLLKNTGYIWYLTCSILADENEKQIQDACDMYNLKIEGKMHRILPDVSGYDGGFGCVLKKL